MTALTEMALHTEKSAALFRDLTSALYSGRITGDQWMAATMQEIKNAHGAFSTLAAGGRDNMTQASWGRVGGNLRVEYGHLRDMAAGIADGSVSEAQALARIRQYNKAGEQAYWNEFRAQNSGAGDSSLPLLTQSPRDGQTVCHGNCGCHLETQEDGVHWILGLEKNCPDCPELALGGPYRLA